MQKMIDKTKPKSEYTKLDNGKIVFPSMTNPKISYLVDREAKTCTCWAFKKTRQSCKHLKSVLENK